MENKLVPLASYPIWQLDSEGIKRSFSLSNIRALFKNLKARSKAKEMLKSFAPDAVIGTGGYVCYPMISVASKMGIYTALHESNAVPGLAVRALKSKVNRIFVSFKGCAEALGKKANCVYTGNPVKTQIANISRAEAREKLGADGKYRYVIVSFGGSLGAQTVNEIALDIMEKITSRRGDVLHIHACGKNGASGFFKSLEGKGLSKCKSIRASEYIYDMPVCMKAADIVICRSGAMTLSELAAAGVASILVPSPNVTADHQYKNALEFSSANAAFVINERNEGECERAISYVNTLLSNKVLREQMAENAKSFARPDAAEQIADEILNSIRIKKYAESK